MLIAQGTNSILQKISLPGIEVKNLLVLREDLIHPFMGGNKWRKLKYNLINFREQNKKVIVTFGGAFSNHLIATAAATNQLGIDCIGIIRGEEVSNPCIEFMKENEMKLFFVNRNDYRKKDDAEFISSLLLKLTSLKLIKHPDDVFIIPEGGSNAAAVEGVSEIGKELQNSKTIFCACGTGATIAGISVGIHEDQTVHGIAVLKAENFLENNILSFGGDLSKIKLHYQYHFGGYAKSNQKLIEFCREFYFLNNFQIEPVYTGKLFFAIKELIKNGTFSLEESMTAVHTGGIYSFFP